MLEAFITALIQAAPREGDSFFLEVGTGSGRITRPLIERGAHLVGVDLSCAKLRQLAAHVQGPPPPLVQASASCLPFPAASLDAIITIHVLHLVADWKRALSEFRRLLRPGGVYLRRCERPAPNSLGQRIRQRWGALLEQAHLPQRHGARPLRAVDATLQALGAVCTPVEVGSHTQVATPGGEVERIAALVRAGAWSIPEHKLPHLLDSLRAWSAAEFGSLEQRFSLQKVFVLHVWRFPPPPHALSRVGF